MLLKFKNKYLLAIEKLIKESDSIGGIIESIILEPKEALGLLLELVDLGKDYTSNIIVNNSLGEDVTREKILWAGLRLDKTERIKELVKEWYKLQYEVTYKDIPLRIVKPKPVEKDAGWMDNAVQPTTIKPSAKKEPPVIEDIISSWNTYGETIHHGKITGVPIPQDDIPPITKQMMDVPKPPVPPPNRLISEAGLSEMCDKCGSSLKSKWFFFKAGGCIQPECENYWENKL